jgi:phosphate-selective porin OprO/OprP
MKNHTLTHKISASVKTTFALAVITSISTSFAQAQVVANERNELSMKNRSTEVTKTIVSSIDDTWNFAHLYDNKQGNYLKLSGRLQLDSAWVDSEQGDFNDTAWRRFRFGFKAQYGEFKVALAADIDLNDSLDDAYNRLTNANLSWVLDKDTELKLLKQSTGFTLDGKISSKKLLTPQRNNLTNNLWFTSEYFTGVSVKS